MKTFLKVVVLVVLLMVLSACSPAPEAVAFNSEAQAVQTGMGAPIPEALIQFFNGVVIALFTAGFVWVFEKFGLDLRQYAIPIATSFATWVVAELQGYINTLPDFQDVYINLIFRILLALIPAFGVLRLFSRQPATLLEHGKVIHK